jgi:hypothetical protein
MYTDQQLKITVEKLSQRVEDYTDRLNLRIGDLGERFETAIVKQREHFD